MCRQRTMIEVGVIEVTTKATHINPRVMPLTVTYSDDFEIDTEGDTVIIKPLDLNCPFCGRLGVKEFGGYYVCNGCRKELKKQNKRRR